MNEIVQANIERYIPKKAQNLFADARCKIRVLGKGETFFTASPSLGKEADYLIAQGKLEAHGVFVNSEKTIYLQTLDPMTVVHEYGHAIDYGLAQGKGRSNDVWSTLDRRILMDFFSASAGITPIITPYSLEAPQEFFAESFRVWCGVPNPESLDTWEPVSPEKLKAYHPYLYRFFDKHFGPRLTGRI